MGSGPKIFNLYNVVTMLRDKNSPAFGAIQRKRLNKR